MLAESGLHYCVCVCVCVCVWVCVYGCVCAFVCLFLAVFDETSSCIVLLYCTQKASALQVAVEATQKIFSDTALLTEGSLQTILQVSLCVHDVVLRLLYSIFISL